MESEFLSNPNPNFAYDVFLNFCGKDAASFASNLCSALTDAKVSVYMDDDLLKSGDSIKTSVLQAIEASRISIVVFSRHYADSTRCLEELEKIIECRKTMDQIVVTVFYEVDRSHVRKQRGPFENAFVVLEQGVWVDKDKLMRWRAALTEASNILGHVVKDSGNESTDIKNVVARVARLLDNTDMCIADDLVGVKSRVQELIQLLDYPQLEYTQLVGICGRGGVGKTTIAKALYNQIGCNFEGKCFLANIGKIWGKQNGQVSLQQQLLSAIYQTTNINIDTSEFGNLMLKERLGQKRMFLVLDDVESLEQMKAFCASREWFGFGSIIIITTRNGGLLSRSEADLVYEMKHLDENESLELFSRKTFKQASPKEDFIQLSKEAAGYCQGLPLDLEVIGRFFYGRDISEWESALRKLKTEDIDFPRLEVLKLCFDGLTDEEKKIFLDIAFFFAGMDKNAVIHKLSTSTLVPEIGIQVLEDRNLVATDENNKLQMHNIIQEVGRKIIWEYSRRMSEPKIYDVFLSFRGKDTRASFISHLYTYLQNAGIYTFKDDDEIQRGDQISLSLPQAIRRSRIAIVVLSQSYANSRWCLMELVDIMKCRRTMDLVVLPLFYGVDPSEVRHQTGEFGASFKDLISGISMDVEHLKDWKMALLEVGGLAGFVIVNTRNESEDIRKVVDKVTDLLDNKDLFVADHPVGVNSRVQDVIRLLNSQQSDDPLLLGIWGMGGLGKTTIAKATYNQMRRNFEAKSILLNVREVWEQNNGQLSLQQRLLFDIYKTTKIRIDSVDSGKMILKERLSQKRIFLLLDDVDKLEQMRALCGNCDWFGKGSRIIITTRDGSLLNSEFGDFHVYSMKAMDENESLELFSWHAFKEPSPREAFADLAREVIKYCGRLPLALQVIGSFLFTRCRRTKEWENVLEKLKIILDAEVLAKLRISFDGLSDDDVKEIFLDIAFFFIGMERDDAIEILNDCGHFAEIGMNILVQQSLVTVDDKNKIGMHDLVRDMGREIVRQKSIKMIEERSRLWLYKDIHEVLSKNTGMIAVEGLTLKSTKMDTIAPWKTKAFQKLDRLRLLQLVGIQLKGDYKDLSRDLRWLCWHGFPLEYTPANFDQRRLVAIDLKYSNLIQVWKKSQMLAKLKILNLSHSPNLEQTPDFSYLPNLEKLILKDCPNLSKVSYTIGHLNKILLINLKDCTGLCELPRSIYKLESLKTLILSGCVNIDKLEEDIEQMKSLTTLIADKTGIIRVPLAIVRSKSIGYISLCGYEGFSRDVFPSIILSWMSPTNSIFSHVQTSVDTSSLVFSDEQNASYSFHGVSSTVLKELQELQRLWVKCDSEVQLNLNAERILGSLNITKSEKFLGGHCHAHNPNSKNSLTTLLFQMGMNCHVTHILRESILQELPPIGRGVLPSDNNPDWLTFNSESSSVCFQVPQVNGRTLKTIMCIVYYSSPDNLTSEGLKNVMLINYSKLTIQLFKKDALTSFENDADEWQRVVSNIEPGNKVKFVVVFENGFTVKKTTIYFIFEEGIDEKNVTVSSGDEKAKVTSSKALTWKPQKTSSTKETSGRSKDSSSSKQLMKGLEAGSILVPINLSYEDKDPLIPLRKRKTSNNQFGQSSSKIIKISTEPTQCSSQEMNQDINQNMEVDDSTNPDTSILPNLEQMHDEGNVHIFEHQIEKLQREENVFPSKSQTVEESKQINPPHSSSMQVDNEDQVKEQSVETMQELPKYFTEHFDFEAMNQLINDDPLSAIENMLSGEISVSPKIQQSTTQVDTTEAQSSLVNQLLEDLKILLFNKEDMSDVLLHELDVEKVKFIFNRLSKVHDQLPAATRAFIIQSQEFYYEALTHKKNYAHAISKLNSYKQTKKVFAEEAQKIRENETRLTTLSASSQEKLQVFNKQIVALEKQLEELKQQRDSLQQDMTKCEEQRKNIKTKSGNLARQTMSILIKIKETEENLETAIAGVEASKAIFKELKFRVPF